MTPSQAAQEKPTSPRRVIDVLEDHTFDASRGGRCSCGQWPNSGERYHTEHIAAAIEREAVAATPSLDALAQWLHEDRIGCSVRCRPFSDGGGQYVACKGPNDHKWQAMTLAARLDEGSATPTENDDE